MANIKLGTDTLTGVNKIRVRNADADGQYVSFGLGDAYNASSLSWDTGGRLVYRPV